MSFSDTQVMILTDENWFSFAYHEDVFFLEYVDALLHEN